MTDAIDPRLAALDPLQPDGPVEEADPFADALTPEPRSAEEAAAHEAKVHTERALMAAVQLFMGGQSRDARANVRLAYLAATEAGVSVNTDHLVAIGAIDPTDAPPPVDLDAAPPAALEEEEEPAPVAKAVVDPFESRPGFVPVYNPMPAPAQLEYNGMFYVVRANGVDFVHEQAANVALGVDNNGGTPMSKLGVRRLYGLEDRFATAATKAGQSLEEYIRRRNDGVRFMADGVWAARAAKVTAIAAKNLRETGLEE